MTFTGWSLRRRGSFVLALTLGLVVLADWLFYEQPLGWSASLFGLALFTAISLRGGQFFRGWPGRVVAGATLGLIVSLLIQPGALAVVLGLLGLVTLAIIDRDGWTRSAAQWVSRWVRFVGRGLTQALRDTALQNRWQRQHPRASRGVVGALATGVNLWMIPVALSAVFVFLFSSANPVVQHRLGDAWNAVATWLGDLDRWLVPARLMLWVVTGVSAWALLRVRLKTRSEKPKRPRRPLNIKMLFHARAPKDGPAVWQAPPTPQRSDGTALVVRCLVLFNAVFAVQTLLDAGYLYGGATLPDSMSYAEYAHRGAYPLVVTALLAGWFVLLMFQPGGAAQRSVWCRRLVGLWVAQNVVLMFSAVWRLSLYVEVYSLTRWRVAAAIWMVLVGVGFVWLIWRIAANRDNAWLLQRVLLTAGVVLYGVCFVDLDGGIARYNVRTCAEAGGPGQPIDLAYLESLGPATIPAITRLSQIADLPSTQRSQTQSALRRLNRELDRNLDNWRGWTVRRTRIAQSVLASATK